VTCEQLFVTPIPDIAGIGVKPFWLRILTAKVRISIYTQVFLALICLTFSSTEKFTSSIRGASGATFIAIAITSLSFLFGAPNGENLVGLGRLRVVLSLSTISYGPGFLSIYRDSEEHRFAPLTHKIEENKTNDPSNKANELIGNIIFSPIVILVYGGLIAEAILFGVCVSRLCGSGVVKAAHFCGFDNVAMTPAEAVGWCFLCFIIPWSMPFIPFFMIAIFKTDPVKTWRLHVRKKVITGVIGKIVFWAFTITLCALTERFLNEDPATFVPGNQEVQWTFGQILPMVLLIALFATLARHLGTMPSYPLPEYQPAHSRFTFYVHLLCNCSRPSQINADPRRRLMGQSSEVCALIEYLVSP